MLVIDTATYERQLFGAGLRGEMRDTSGNPRVAGSTLSLMNLTNSLGVNAQGIMHNAGNDAFLCMLDLQVLMDPEATKVPNMMGSNVQQTIMRNAGRGPMAMGMGMMTPSMPMYGMMSVPSPLPSPSLYGQLTPPDLHDGDAASSRRGSPSQASLAGRPRKASNLSMPRRSSGSPNGNGTVEAAAEKLNALRVG